MKQLKTFHFKNYLCCFYVWNITVCYLTVKWDQNQVCIGLAEARLTTNEHTKHWTLINLVCTASPNSTSSTLPSQPCQSWFFIVTVTSLNILRTSSITWLRVHLFRWHQKHSNTFQVVDISCRSNFENVTTFLGASSRHMAVTLKLISPLIWLKIWIFYKDFAKFWLGNWISIKFWNFKSGVIGIIVHCYIYPSCTIKYRVQFIHATLISRFTTLWSMEGRQLSLVGLRALAHRFDVY